MKELAKRLSVAAWGIPLLLFLSYMGGVYFLALILIVNAMALWEFYSIFHGKSIYPYRLSGVVGGTALLLSFYWHPDYSLALFMAAVAFALLMYLRPQKGTASLNVAFTLAGMAYISLLLGSLLLLRGGFEVWVPEASRGIASLGFEEWFPQAAGQHSYAGGRLVILMLAAIWICDTAAYFGGKALGKHKLAPTISPNKTVEGALFGLVFGIATFMLLGAWFLPGLSSTYTLLSGALVGVVGQLGDLVESRFKRDAGVKDTSALLPGHGGFFDRFDSIIYVSPFLWALYWLGS